MLIKDPEKRLGFKGPKDIITHPWFKGMPSIHDIRAKNIKAPKDNEARPPYQFVDGYTPPPPPVEIEEVEEEEEEEEEEGMLANVPVSKPSKESKWAYLRKGKGTRKGYYAKPRTELQRTTSRDRRNLLGNLLVDIDVEDDDICFRNMPAEPPAGKNRPKLKKGMTM
jgi:hypothetical protein